MHAKRLLEEIGVKRDVIVTADPALLLEPQSFTVEMLEREGVTSERPARRHWRGRAPTSAAWPEPAVAVWYLPPPLDGAAGTGVAGVTGAVGVGAWPHAGPARPCWSASSSASP